MRQKAGLGSLVAAVAVTVTSTGWAQQWSKWFVGIEVNKIECMRQTADGGFVGAGRVGLYPSGSSEVWFVRLDALGNVMWQKTYGGPRWEEARAVELTGDGGFVVAGQTDSFGAGLEDVWVLRLDSLGNVLWQRTYGGAGKDSAAGLAVLSDGSIVVAGTTTSFGAGGSDLWVMKLDKSGFPVWQRAFGGPDLDGARGVRPTSDGGFVVAGFTAGDYYSESAWVLRFDAAGGIVWQTALGQGGLYRLAAVSQRGDGGFFAGGTISSFGSGSKLAWVVRLDAAGSILRQRVFYTSGWVGISDVAATADGGLVATGTYEGWGDRSQDMWVAKLDPAGAITWQGAYGGDSYQGASSARPTSDGGYVVGGWGEVPWGAGILKLNPQGDIPNCDQEIHPLIQEWDWSVPVVTASAALTSQSAVGPSTASVAAAYYEPAEYCFQPRMVIALSAHGTGAGDVMCQPNPVDYGFSSTCTATPGVGSHFVGATTTCAGALQGTNPFTVGPVTADCAVAAEFALNSYRIGVVVNNPEWGTVSCAPSPATHGATVECHAVPSNGYRLRSISGCDGATVSETYRFIATGECTVSVTFEPIPDPIPALSWHGLGLAAGLLASVGALILRRTTSLP